MSGQLNRRSLLKGILAGSAVLGFPTGFSAFAKVNQQSQITPDSSKGQLKHSVARWCFNDFNIETLCIELKKIGVTGIDLVGPKDWPVLKKHGLLSTMCNGAEINLVDGFNDEQFHEKLLKNYSQMIPLVADAGYQNLICFSGSKRGKTDEEGWQNCVKSLQQLIPLAEKYNVILVMELLNSKLDHHDYQCNKTSWGVELAKRLNSDHFKLLYDIYHMQIDEGDVIRTITENHHYIAHYHTAGVPGRHEIDETQELNYAAIMKAIAATGFKGFIGQEFIPKNANKLESLKKAISICSI
ncbi:hydroxypyruvate isomerase family protein [Flavobacterium muglaense]|uniref:TIM barrel protein n=1 Tax=Flavobacterium muglaense TaxID=2764716 RepID=A0A923SF41_9FLAO|nr:TIM barrel protein [Flavobacterium muglaense]MBC5837688.1 TIM barrel protein [Flavobacterium muglaense]MBC5844196.1 TIM barrel protein [Flavobacterium muglaense]